MALGGSVTLKISCVILLIAIIMFVIGFAAPYWHSRDFTIKPTVLHRHHYEGRRHFGLWTFCEEYERWDVDARGRRVGRIHFDECNDFLGGKDIGFRKDVRMDELRATQFFETIGLIGAVATFVLCMIALCVESCQDRRIMPIMAAVVCLATAGCIILGTIIFGSTEAFADNLSWAFALSIVGGVMFAIIGVLILVGAIVNK